MAPPDSKGNVPTMHEIWMKWQYENKQRLDDAYKIVLKHYENDPKILSQPRLLRLIAEDIALGNYVLK